MNYSDMIEKAKYISRKKVKGKWVYKYADDPSVQQRPKGERDFNAMRTSMKPSRSFEHPDVLMIEGRSGGRGKKDKKKMIAEIKGKLKNLTDRELQELRNTHLQADPTINKLAEAEIKPREAKKRAADKAAREKAAMLDAKRKEELAEREKRGEVLLPQKAAWEFTNKVEELAKLLSGNPEAQKKLIAAKRIFVNEVMDARGLYEPDGGYFGDRDIFE